MKKFLVTGDDGVRQVQEGPIPWSEVFDASARIFERLGVTTVTVEQVDEENEDEPPFVVYGLDDDYTELSRHWTSGDARGWVDRYTRHENAGGWHLIEVYDERNPDATERLYVWSRENEI